MLPLLRYTRQTGPARSEIPVYFKIDGGTPAQLSEGSFRQQRAAM
jgi:hypothetical protein